MWKKKSEVFLKKKCLKVCRLRKKLYLCTRIQGNASQYREICGNSSVGRARPCQGRGRGSESRLPLIILNNPMFLESTSPGGGIGRRARFRCVCFTTCRFESCSGHQRLKTNIWRGGGIGRRATLRG